MTVIFERRQSASAIWARRVAIFSAVLLVVAVVGHRFALVPTIPFFNVLGVVAALAALALLMAGIDSNWQGAFVGGFIILAVLLGMQTSGTSLRATLQTLFAWRRD